MQVGFFQFDVVRSAGQNLTRLERSLRKNRCDVLVLPELASCGYLAENRAALLARAEPVPGGPFTGAMQALSEQYGCTLVFGLAEAENGRVYNTAAVVSKGKYIGKYRKIHLSDYEKTLFDRGCAPGVFSVDGVTLGVQICFDLWFPELTRQQIRLGAQLLCAPANFGGPHTGHIARVRAMENLTPLVLCNRVGSESVPGMDADFLGKSAVIGRDGALLCRAPAGRQRFGCCSLTPGQKRANVICADFDSEIALHRQD